MRSLLFVPGDSEKKLNKALTCGADTLLIDLEDSVAPDNKVGARTTAANFIKETSDLPERPRLYVRINAFDSGLMEDDLAAVLSAKPDGVMLPKSNHGQDVTKLDARLNVLDADNAIREGKTSFLAIVTETAMGVLNAGTYKATSKRLAGMSWGAEDLAADIGARRKRDELGHYRDLFRYARIQCLLGAVAAGVQPIDTVFTNFRDEKSLREECEEAAIDGFTGKLAIHPAQVSIINAAFTPKSEAIKRAKAIIQAFEDAGNPGVVGLDGEMLDQPHLKLANRILHQARLAGVL